MLKLKKFRKAEKVPRKVKHEKVKHEKVKQGGKHPLCIKLVVFCLLMALIPLGIANFLSYSKAQKALSARLDHLLLMRAYDTANGLDDWIIAMRDDVQGMSLTLPDVQTDDEINNYLKQRVKRCNNYDAMFTVNMEGIISHHSNTSGIGIDVSGQDYFREALKGNTFISDVMVSQFTGDPIFYISTLVKDNDDKGTGVLVTGVSMNKISHNILNIKLGTLGYAQLIDKKGIFLVHPNKDFVMNEKKSAFVTDDKHAKQVTEHMVNGKTGNDIYIYNKIQRHVGYAPIAATGWSIGFIVPDNDPRLFKDINQLRHYLLSLVLAAVILITVMTTVIACRIVRPIKELTAVANVISSGDLTAEVKVATNDEVGQLASAFKKMVDSLRETLHHVAFAAENLSASSEEIAASLQQTSSMTEQMTLTVDELAKGATEQASMVEETSDTINQMATSMQQIAGNAQMTNEEGKNAKEAADNGKIAVDKAIQKMVDAQEAVKESAVATKALGENSQEIGKIVEVITGVADQTNLLALNAAIEAARAGEQGRGFAVVADEVRKLAEESSNAAGQIEQLIAQVQQETDSTVALMNKGAEVVEEGSSAVIETGDAFKDIHTSIDRIATEVEEVSAASQQISVGSGQVVGAINNIANITEESAAGTQQAALATQEQMGAIEEIAASSENLARLAEELQKQVGKFNI